MGLGLVHHGRKPLKTSQNHNGSQEPETSETLEALQLLLYGLQSWVNFFWVSVCRISEEDLDSFLTSLTAAADYDTFLKERQGFHCIGPFVTRTLCQLFGQFMSELFIPFSSLYFWSGGTLGHWKEPDMIQSAITPTLQKFDSGR